MAGSAAIKAAYRRGIIHRARPMAGRAALASPMSGLARLRGVRILRIVSATDILIGAAVPAMDAETGAGHPDHDVGIAVGPARLEVDRDAGHLHHLRPAAGRRT